MEVRRGSFEHPVGTSFSQIALLFFGTSRTLESHKEGLPLPPFISTCFSVFLNSISFLFEVECSWMHTDAGPSLAFRRLKDLPFSSQVTHMKRSELEKPSAGRAKVVCLVLSSCAFRVETEMKPEEREWKNLIGERAKEFKMRCSWSHPRAEVTGDRLEQYKRIFDYARRHDVTPFLSRFQLQREILVLAKSEM